MSVHELSHTGTLYYLVYTRLLLGVPLPAVSSSISSIQIRSRRNAKDQLTTTTRTSWVIYHFWYQIQYGGRLLSETGSSFISAVNWRISTKFGMHIELSTYTNELCHRTRNRKLICGAVAAIVKNAYDIIQRPAVIRFRWNSGRRRRITSWLRINGQNRNLK